MLAETHHFICQKKEKKKKKERLNCIFIFNTGMEKSLIDYEVTIMSYDIVHECIYVCSTGSFTVRTTNLQGTMMVATG